MVAIPVHPPVFGTATGWCCFASQTHRQKHPNDVRLVLGEISTTQKITVERRLRQSACLEKQGKYMGIWLLTALASMARAACEDPGVLVVDLEKAVLEARMEDAADLLKRMEVAFSCGPVAPPGVLGRMWLAEGVMLSLQGDDEMDSFAAAARVAPNSWREEYGVRFAERYQEAGRREESYGNIGLEPPLVTYVGAVDGQVVDFPVRALGGLHLLQVGPAAGPMAFSKVFLLSENENLQLRTGLTEGSVAAEEPFAHGADEPLGHTETVEPTKKPVPVFLVAGGTAGVLAAASAVVALQQTNAMRKAEDMDELDAAHLRQQVFGISAYTLTGLAATGVVLHFVF